MRTINKNGLLYDFKKNWRAYVFIAPVVLGVLIFSLYPIFSSLYFSFFNYNLAYPPYGFGVHNYVKIFTSDWAKVGKSIAITAIYTAISVPVMLVLSFSLALLLNKKTKGIGLYRTLIYLPVVMPTVISALLWSDILDPTYGVANTILGALRLPKSQFIYSSDTALASVIVMNFWNAGGSMILWLSALKNVPKELLESARIDGAGALRRLGSVILPMCTPIIFYNLITSVIGSLQTFGSYFMVSGGGPDDSLLFFGVKIYLEGFYSHRFGYACALSWLMFLIVGALSAALFKTNRWVYYEE